MLLPEDVEVVETPAGPVFHMVGGEYRIGDRVRSGGGRIEADGYPRRLLDRLSPRHRGRST